MPKTTETPTIERPETDRRTEDEKLEALTERVADLEERHEEDSQALRNIVNALPPGGCVSLAARVVALEERLATAEATLKRQRPNPY